MNNQERQLKCYTIGHSNYPIGAFTYFLSVFRIDCIIDVRSSPYSRNNPQYNRENLKTSLGKEGVEYRYYGDRLGGRYYAPDLLYPDGTVNYGKISQTSAFQEAIQGVIGLIEKGRVIALMCSEREPERCHRFALVSRNLQQNNVNVIHIIPGVKTQTNVELEGGLKNKYLDKNQSTIDNTASDDVETLYEIINKNIGFKVKTAYDVSNFKSKGGMSRIQTTQGLRDINTSIREENSNQESGRGNLPDEKFKVCEGKKNTKQKTLFN